MPLLVDGYNVLFGLGFVPRRAGPAEMDDARRALLDLLADHLGEQSAQATVVFDAPRAPRHVHRQSSYRGITIVLSARGQEADDLIEEMITSSPSPKTLTVVSNDHRLIHAAERRGAIALRADDFLAWLDQQKKTPPVPAPAPEKQDNVNAEQVAQWMDAFGHLDDDPALGESFPFRDAEDIP